MTGKGSRRTLLIDGGQSACRAAVLSGGTVGPVETVAGLRRVGRAYDGLRELVARHRVDAVAAGLTGYAGEELDLGVPAIITNDAVIAYLGALGEQPGAVIVAGTGVIALAAAADGTWARADGWGTLLGDDGGGYWIGRRALALALRAQDGRGGSPELLRRARERFGDELVRAVYDAPDPVATIASFTRDIADAEDAAAIFADAGRELAATVKAALRGAGAPPVVSWSGGLFAAGDLILDPFRAALGLELRPPLGDGLAGAARFLEGTELFR